MLQKEIQLDSRILCTNNFNLPFSRILVLKEVKVTKCAAMDTAVTIFLNYRPVLNVCELVLCLMDLLLLFCKRHKGLACCL